MKGVGQTMEFGDKKSHFLINYMLDERDKL